ncbi:MAG: gentisate 1,2-dioxygenase [Chloroflexota bacterium]|jgi:gentisate 1,2-dioxygenase|nr:gentisate 1,2-dioxygenase [Chloroflexota bacterium]
MAVEIVGDAMESFYKEIQGKDMDALWRRHQGGRPDLSYPVCHWRWVDIEGYAYRATELVKPGPNAERRVILLINPEVGGLGATHTLTAAVQIVMPGEVAPSHRHTAAAIRFIIQGSATVTMVDGEPCEMHPGDLILTPGWTWHGHINQGDGPMIWMDSLDAPVVGALRAMRQEPYPDELHPATKPIGDSLARYGTGFLQPAWQQPTSPISPLLSFPWSKTEPALHDLARVGASPFDDVAFRYTNPATGRHVLPTIGCWIQMLRPGVHTQAHRHTTSAVYHVFRGRGSTIVNGVQIDWEQGDFIALPQWSWHEHINRSSTEEAILFSTTDAPVLEALNLYVEEPYTERDGHQMVTGSEAAARSR